MSENEDDDAGVEEEEQEESTRVGQEGEGPEEGEAAAEGGEPTPPAIILPEKRPFTGAADLHFGAGLMVKVVFTDPSLPQWLPYIVTDDSFWFQRTVAELDAAAGEAAAAAGSAEGEAAPPSVAAVADEPEANEADATGAKAFAAIPFDANLKLVLERKAEGDATFVYVAKVYVPPADATSDAPGDAAPPVAAEVLDSPTEEALAEDLTATGVGIGSAQPEEKGDADEILLDVVTLAACYSPAALQYILSIGTKDPSSGVTVSLAGLEDWCSHTIGASVAPEGLSVIENIYAASQRLQEERTAAHEKAFLAKQREELAQQQPPAEVDDSASPPAAREKEIEKAVIPPCPPQRFGFDYSWVFEKLSRDPVRYAGCLLLVIRRLLASQFIPSKPIEPAYLRTPDAVQAYCLLLVSMPRSLLIRWTRPPPSEDDADAGAGAPEGTPYLPLANGVGQIVLDLRTRNARAKAGKPPLRQSALNVHRKHFALASIDDGKYDFVVASPFSSRTYPPADLQLSSSDLLLTLLGLAPEESGAESFRELFQSKAKIVRGTDSTSGTYMMLFSSVHLMSPAAVRSLLELSPQNVFAPFGLVDLGRWVSTTAPKFPQDQVPLFAKRFFHSVLRHPEETLAALKAAAPVLYNALSDSQAALDHFRTSLTRNTATEPSLEEALALLGPESVATPYALGLAIDSGCSAAVEWLFARRGVVTVAHTEGGHAVPAIEHAIRSRNLFATSLLVHLGADLKALWANGVTNGLTYIENQWMIDDEAETLTPSDVDSGSGGFSLSPEQKLRRQQVTVVRDLIELWRKREHERATDPSKRFGLLLATEAAN